MQQQEKAKLEQRFDQIFTTNSSFETLNQVLVRLNRRKRELLKVLDKPELPLHNNASEQDIREFVTKRKISGSTRSDIELSVLNRQCLNRRLPDQDTLKLEIAAWEEDRNQQSCSVNWRFTTADARIKQSATLSLNSNLMT